MLHLSSREYNLIVFCRSRTVFRYTVTINFSSKNEGNYNIDIEK